jgi:hypothetical protein
LTWRRGILAIMYVHLQNRVQIPPGCKVCWSLYTLQCFCQKLFTSLCVFEICTYASKIISIPVSLTSHPGQLLKKYNEAFIADRVIRLGEFFTYWAIVIFGQVIVENYRSRPNFCGLHFSTEILIKTKKGFGYILSYFFHKLIWSPWLPVCGKVLHATFFVRGSLNNFFR